MTQTQQQYHPSASMKHFSLGMLAGMCMLSASLGILNNVSNSEEIFATQSVIWPVDGVCGPVNGSALFSPVTFSTPGLCRSGQISRIIEDSKNKKVYRNCIGDAEMQNDRCEWILIPTRINNESTTSYKTPDEVIKRDEKKRLEWNQFRKLMLWQ